MNIFHALDSDDRKCRRATIRVIVLMLAISAVAFAQSAVDRSWTALQAGLSSKDVEDRSAAVRLLGLIEENSQAGQFALKALSDERPEVRSAAAEALGQMKAKFAISQLEEFSKKEREVSVILAAGRALIALGDPLGYAVYYAVLTGEKKSGASLLDEQKKMLNDPKKMAQFGFETGIGFVPFGKVGYGAFKAINKDDTSPVRAAAAKILAADTDPKSGEALIAACSDKSWTVRAAALDAISHRNDSSLLPKIEGNLTDDKQVVRFVAAAAIIHLTDLQKGTGR